MSSSNLIELQTDDYLPRWRWSDLNVILAATLPPHQRPLMAHLLEMLKADASGLNSKEVLADVLLAIRMASNQEISLSFLQDAANTS
jgi:hypothetical protein